MTYEELSTLSDAELIEHLRVYPNFVTEILLKRYKSKLEKLIWEGLEKDQIITEAFLALIKSVSEGKQVNNTEAFLVAVTLRRAVEQKREKERRRKWELPLGEQDTLLHKASVVNQDGEVLQQEIVDAVKITLERLPEKERKILTYLMDGMAYGQIGFLYGKSAGYVSGTIHKVKKKFQRYFEEAFPSISKLYK